MSTAAIDGRYIVEETLGRGGMGIVYRVRDSRTGAHLALKRAWANDVSRAARRRELLEREFYTLAELRHPRIIEVYDFGVDADGPYYTMELLDGADLDNIGRMPWRAACGVICDIASSLAIMHSRGLLHRDVSTRNVRKTEGGHAKLIDFGVMSSTGILGDAIGTPPFMPPESVQMQALDPRVDLFSLGALAYFALTGRHAYPAHRVSDLRDSWRSRPTPPQRLVPDIPPALGALVLQLLALDRAARPQSASELMERVSSIAALPIEDLPRVTRAYLTTPVLVGRDEQLVTIRSHILPLQKSRGGLVMIEGPEGSGRSRMLDACVLEAKLLGAQIVRDGPAEDEVEQWATVRRLCSRIFELMPDRAHAAAHLGRSVLAHVVDELASHDATARRTKSATVPERSVLLRELRDFMFAVCAGQRLVLAIDDADRIDEASSSLLAAVADKVDEHSLVVVLVMRPAAGVPRSASERLLRRLSNCISLAPLAPEQTVTLMRSVFGDIPNLHVCARTIHAIAHGNPRVVMELGQHLVDRGLARYDTGRWSLPSRLAESDLPDSLTTTLVHRLGALPQEARELAEALAVSDGSLSSIHDAWRITGHDDARQQFVALQDLVRARVLIASATELRFSQRAFVRVLVDELSDARRCNLHGRVADILGEVGGDVARRIHHLFCARREREGLQLLCGLELRAHPIPLTLFEQAVDYAELNSDLLDARTLHRLHTTLMTRASTLLAIDSFERCLPHVIRQLEHDTGADFYRELSHLPESERLASALAKQQARYLATPPHAQVNDVIEAVRELATLTGATCSIAGSVLDLKLLERLPSLEPFVPLTPALHVVVEIANATRELVHGAHARASAHFQAVLSRIEQPDHAGMSPHQHAQTRVSVHYALALIDASSGLSRAEERAKILENDRRLRVSAWRIRSLLALNQGDTGAAQDFSRRAEVLRLQDEHVTQYIGTDAALELTAYERLGDLFGVKSALDTIEVLATTYPGWAAFVPWARSSYNLLKGDLQSAEEAIAPAVDRLKAGVDLAYGGSAIQHVRVMRALGADHRALEKAYEYVKQFEEHALSLRFPFLQLEVSLLEAHIGNLDQAVARITRVTAERESAGIRGFPLGIFYETRARMAARVGERSTFEEFATKCRVEYSIRPSANLRVKYANLVDEAHEYGFELPPEVALAEVFARVESAEEDRFEILRDRFAECVDTADRARCALTLLLQNTSVDLGYLYGVEPTGIVLLSGLPDAEVDPELEAWLRAWTEAERSRSDGDTKTGEIATEPEVTVSDDAMSTAGGGRGQLKRTHSSSDGKSFFVVPLIAVFAQKRRLYGLFVAQVLDSRVPHPPFMLVRHIGRILLEAGDLTGVDV